MSFQPVGLRISVLLFAALGEMLGGSSPLFGQTRVVPSRTTCATCKITIDTGVVLTLPADSLSFGNMTRVTAISRGRFAAAPLPETHAPAIFDSTGIFVRLLARVGSGPGELPYAEAVIAAPGDSVWVIDGSIQGRHVFTGNLEFVRRERAAIASTQIAFGPNRQIAAAAWIRSPGRAGFPLHIIERHGLRDGVADSIRSSFGVENPTFDPGILAASGDDPQTAAMRYLTRGEGSTFWAYNPTRFLLEQYDFSGTLLVRAQHEMSGWYSDATSRKPGIGGTAALPLSIVQQSRSPGVLWLVYHDRRPDWVRRNVRDNSLSGYAAYNDLVIEAVETPSMRLLAMHRLPRTLALKVESGPDLLAVVKEVSEYFVQLQIIRLELSR